MQRPYRVGFTLIELLVVIAIIGILAAVILPRLNDARELAQVTQAQAELREIANAARIMYNDTNVYPNGATDFCRDTLPSGNEVDLNAPAAGLTANGSGWSGWDGPYIESATDPWGNPYFLDEDYNCDAETTGCKGKDDPAGSNDSSVIVSCGPNEDLSADACAYDADNVVLLLCQ